MHSDVRPPGVIRRLDHVTLVTYGVALAIAAAWTFRAVHDPNPADLGLAYQAGQVTWATGHPETLFSWTGTPVLAAAMAVIGRMIGVGTATHLLTALNTVLVLGTGAVVTRRLRRALPARWWCFLTLAMVSFGPVMSTVWWKQFNLVALVLVVGGFALLLRSRVTLGAAAIGVSVALKPLAVLLIVVLIARRGTRRAGLIALGWVAGLTLAALVLIALRAPSLSGLNPLTVYQNFAAKTDPFRYGYACYIDNFSPTATLCRLGSGRYWTVVTIVGLGVVALLGAWVAEALRDRRALSWDAFGFVCALSAMIGPIAWSHYQVMLLPLFVLLLVRFVTDGASYGAWAGLALAFVLASLAWQPYGTSIDFVGNLIAHGRVVDVQPVTQGLISTEAVAQFAQYLLVVTGVLWFWQARVRASESAALAR